MAAFLLLQKFGRAGSVVNLPYAQVLELLARHGSAVEGTAPQEFMFAPDLVASRCWVIGDAASGVACIGLERPLFDEGLRALVWDAMRATGCAAFDDRLHRIYVPLRAAEPVLPEKLLAAGAHGAQPIGAARQLWPAFLEFDEPLAATHQPALMFKRPGFANTEYQLVDKFEPITDFAIVELRLHPSACNSGTLAVLQALCRRVHWALRDKTAKINYRFDDSEVAAAFLEVKALDDMSVPVLFVSPFPGSESRPVIHFVPDREVHHSTLGQAEQFAESARKSHGLILDGSAASIVPLSRWLDTRQSRAGADRLLVDTDEVALAISAGSYVANLLRRHVGGQIGYIATGSRRLPVVLAHRGDVFHPHAQVLGYVVNGQTQSLEALFQRAIEAQLSAAPRDPDIVAEIHGYCSALRGRGDVVQPLPGDADLPRDQLDYSFESLAVLDRYLLRIGDRRKIHSLQLDAVVVLVGAYLGEVVRSRAQPGAWAWKTYEDTAKELESAEQWPPGLPRKDWAPDYSAILDGPSERAYPMAQVRFVLETGTEGCVAFAVRVLGMVDLSAADPAPEPEPESPPEPELEPDAECPNCDKPIHTSHPKCVHCGADFTGSGGWRPLKPGEKPREPVAAAQAPPVGSRDPVASKEASRGAVYRLSRLLTYIAHVLLGIGLVMVAIDHFGLAEQAIEGERGAGLGWAIASLVFYLPAFILGRLAKPTVRKTEATGKADR